MFAYATRAFLLYTCICLPLTAQTSAVLLRFSPVLHATPPSDLRWPNRCTDLGPKLPKLLDQKLTHIQTAAGGCKVERPHAILQLSVRIEWGARTAPHWMKSLDIKRLMIRTCDQEKTDGLQQAVDRQKDPCFQQGNWF